MADKTGYIGRNPNDSAVTVARQFFTASGVTTAFTFASGYLTGYLDVYVDGVKKRVADEFTATDGSTFDVLQGGVGAGSTVEAVAYKAFNAAAVSGDITGNFDVSGNTTLGGSLDVTGGTTVTNLVVTGISTLGTGTTVGFANTAFNLGGTPNISVDLLSAVDINVSGAATIGGVLTYEDVTNIDSIGIVTARTGVEVTANGLVVNAGVGTFAADLSIADKLVHTGDTNTSIRFPTGDTITAETAGVERLRIDSTGDVGLVGIATATGLVVVAGSGIYAGHTGIITAVTFDGNLTGDVTGNTSGTAGGLTGTPNIDCGTGSFTGDVDIADKIIHTGDTNTAIRFPANDTFTVETDGSEAFRITGDQRIGIGTDDPLRQLEVYNSTNAIINLKSDTQSSVIFSDPADTNIGMLIYEHSSDSMQFRVNDAERARIDSSGRLLVGVTTTAFANDVNFQITDNTNAKFLLRNPNYGTFSLAVTNDSVLALKDEANAAERLRITSAGDVHIGTTNTVVFGSRRALTVANGTTGAVLSLYNSTTATNNPRISSNPGGSEINDIGIHAASTNGTIQFYTSNDTERLRIDSSGRMLLGTTSARTNYFNSTSYGPLLNLEGTGNANRVLSFIHNDSSGAPLLVLGATGGSSAGSNTIIGSSGKFGFLSFQGADGSQLVEGAKITGEVDGTPGADDMPGRLVFFTTADGAASPTERLRITSAGDITMSGTGSLKIPVGTTAQRTGSAAAGMFRYNSTTGGFEGYTTEWGEIGGGGGMTTAAHLVTNDVVHIALSAAQDHKITATGLCTVFPGGGTEGESHTIRIINSGIATVGFSTQFLFPSGSAPSLPTADGSISIVSFTVNKVGVVGIATELLSGASLNYS